MQLSQTNLVPRALRVRKSSGNAEDPRDEVMHMLREIQNGAVLFQ